MKNTQKKRMGHPCVPVSQTQVENYILRIRRLAAPEYVRPADKAQNYERLCLKAADSHDGDEHRDDSIRRMISFLTSRYRFRYNTVMKYTEYCPTGTGSVSPDSYLPLEPRTHKRMTIDVQLAGINVSIKDVRNFLESDHIADYNPVAEYLDSCDGLWDGRDHIRALARTVPTDNPHWTEWFYTWFLAMVAQWRSDGRQLFGNSVAPLLISPQGYCKSTFCRRILPDELTWGYTDNLQLQEKRQVMQAMSQQLLINLDEFNQISPNIQQGFLKNIIQMPNVKMKRPYGRHVEMFPRTASFIATSNMTDILADPSGNRRFIGIELTAPIDVSHTPNHRQLYAQALAALRSGAKHWFDAEATRLVMQNNGKYEVGCPLDQCFHAFFSLTNDERKGEYLSAAQIFNHLRTHIGSSVKINSLNSFGRKLSQTVGIRRKRTEVGMKYLVVKRD